ncbi:AbiTii domain-containing protein [Methanococcoides sp. FTZ1]|uniref:AbiTii domain-containing protein n=1 Tax=Methanococcoides sp. FTZ1 TaxID=3439061 RepID=UPI003F84B01D
MVSRIEEAINLAEDILTDIEEYGDVEKSLRKYYKLTKLTNNKNENLWANYELVGYQNNENVPQYRIFRAPQKLYIGNMEEWIYIKDNCETLKMISKSGKGRRCEIVSNNQYSKLLNNNTILVSSQTHYKVLVTVKNRIYSKTTDVLFELKFEKIESDIFNETRNIVDQELNEICPNAFQKLTETYENIISSDSPLELQQVAFACRTVLDDFADSVYPPKDEKVIGFDDKAHPVKDSHHVNRIIQYVYENIDSDSTNDFMKSNLEYLNNFLRNIYEQANIGTHTERQKEHANRCVIYTYLVLGDVIRLSKSSAK